jgi:hypothetical protein
MLAMLAKCYAFSYVLLMDNSISEALLEGKPLSLSIGSWSNQYFQLANLPAD